MVHVNITGFQVDEGSLKVERIDYRDHFGNDKSLFVAKPQDNKVVSVNKAASIKPDTGYSYMKKVTITNTAPSGANVIYYTTTGYIQTKIRTSEYYQNAIWLDTDTNEIVRHFTAHHHYRNILNNTIEWYCLTASETHGKTTVGGDVIDTSTAPSLQRPSDGRIMILNIQFADFPDKLTF